jgi:pimeloyl-ACP methyl ester carboxylesterase
LEKLVVLIKNKYGNDINLFLYGGSWGGYLGFAYLTKDNNQANIKGWIDESGAHNFALTGNAERRILMEYANILIPQNKDKAFWQEVLGWCESNHNITTSENFLTINSYAIEATSLIGDSINETELEINGMLSFMLFGPSSSNQFKVNTHQISKSPIIKNIIDLDLSLQLYKVTIPVLIAGGKHDLIVPNEVLHEAFNNVGSVHKELVIFEKSGHAPSATKPNEFSTTVINFIEKFR